MRHPVFEMPRRFPRQMFCWFPVGTDLTGYTCYGGARLLPEGLDDLTDTEAAVDVAITAGDYAGDGVTKGPGWILTPDHAAVLGLSPGDRLLADLIITDAGGNSVPTLPWIWEIYETASVPA